MMNFNIFILQHFEFIKMKLVINVIINNKSHFSRQFSDIINKQIIKARPYFLKVKTSGTNRRINFL